MAHKPSLPTLLEERSGDRMLQAPPRRTRFTLRSQMVLAALLLILLTGAVYVRLRESVLHSFDDLQRETIERDTQRVLNAMDAQLRSLNDLARNWAASSEVVGAIQGDEAPIADAMSDSTLENFDLNVFLVLNLQGEMVFGKIMGSDGGPAMVISPLVAQAYLGASGLNFNMEEVTRYTDGILLLPQYDLDAVREQAQTIIPQLMPMLPDGLFEDLQTVNLAGNSALFALEVVYSSQSRAPVGILVLGRLMPPSAIAKLGHTTETRLTTLPVDQPDQVTADFSKAREALLAGQSMVVQNLNDDYAAGYSLLRDLRGDPALILRVENKRLITRHGLTIANQIFGGAALAGVAVLFLVAALLEWAVIRRTLRLSRFVRRVGESGNVSLRAYVSGRDELTDLGDNINAMLASLEESQRLLSDNREQLEQILASISDIVYMLEISPRGEVLQHRLPSPQIATLTGYPQARFDADFTFWQSLILPGDLDEARNYLAHPIAFEDSQVEYRIVNAAGQMRWIRDQRHLRPVPNSDSVIVYGVLSDITARKAAEAELAAERNLLRTVIDIQLHSVYVKDRERRVVLCNPADARWRGVEGPDDALGKTDEDFYPPEIAAKFTADDLCVMENDRPIINREETAPFEGEMHWLLTTKVPLHDAEGRVIGLVGVGQDITERKQMEEELRRAKDELELRVEQRTAEVAYERNLLRTLIDALPDHVYVKDAQGRFLTVNRSTAQGFDCLNPEDVIGKTDFDFFDAATAETFRQDELSLQRGEVTMVSHERPTGLNADGSPANWYWTIKVPFYQPDGQVGGIVGIGRDISERKRMEEELRQAGIELEQRVKERTADLRAALIELRHSEERFEQAFMYAPTGVALVSLEGHFLKVNPALAEMVGYTPDELEKYTPANITVPEDRWMTEDVLLRAPVEQRPTYHFEKRYLHRDGRVVWVSVTSSLVRAADDSPAYMVTQVQNITERKQAESEREALIQAIQARANELATAAEISRQATTILDTDRLLHTAVELIRTNFHFYDVCIFRLDETGTMLVPAAGSGELVSMMRDVRIPLDTEISLIARAARTRQTVVSNDTTTEESYLPHPLLTETRSELVMPMIVGDELLGILNIEDNRVNRFTTDDVNILVTLAAQLANALYNAQLFTENGRRLAIIEQSADLIALCKYEEPLQVGYVNSAGARMMGAESPETLLNRPVADFYPPDAQKVLREQILPVVLDKGSWRGEQVMQRLDGTQFPVELTILAIPGRPGEPIDLATINTDITRRKQAEAALYRANRAYRVLSECNQAMVHAEDEAGLLREICQIIVRESGYHVAWVAYPERPLPPDGTFTGELRMNAISAAGHNVEMSANFSFELTQAQIDAGMSPSGTALQTRQPVVISHPVSYPPFEAYKEQIAQGGLDASIVLPLIIDGLPAGVLYVFSRDQNAFDEGEVGLLVELAGDLAYGITAQRARREREEAQEKLRQANSKLGQSNRSLLTLHEVGRTLTTALDAATIYDVLYWALLHPLFKAPTCLVSLYDEASGEVTCAYVCMEGDAVDPAVVPVHTVEQDSPGDVLRTRQPYLIRYDRSQVNPPLPMEHRPAVGVVVPLISGDQVLGVLHVLHHDPNAITDEDIPLLSIMANQTAAALQNAQLFAAEREQRAMAEALRDVTTAINSTLDLTEVMDCILNNLEDVVPHDTASFMLIEGGRARVMRHKGFVERGLGEVVSHLSFDMDSSPKFAQMRVHSQPVIFSDVQETDEWSRVPGLEWIRSHIGAPIRLGEELLGVLNLDSATPGFFTPDSAVRLQAFADQASVALQNARLFSAEREQRTLAEALRDITAAISSTLNVDQTLALILENVGIVVPHTAANIMLVDGDNVYVAAHRGYEPLGLKEYMDHWRYPLAERPSIAEQVASGESLVISNARNFNKWVDVPQDRWVGSVLVMPIKVDGQTIGLLNLDHVEPNAFNLEQVERLKGLAAQASSAVRNAQLYAAEREQRALSDALRETAAAVNSTLDPDTVIGTIMTSIRQVIPYDSASVTMLDGEMVRMVHNVGYAGRVPEGWEQRWGAPISALQYMSRMRATGEPVVIPDTHKEPGWTTRFSPEKDWIRSALKAPLHIEGVMVGAIHLESVEPDAFDDKDASRLMAFVNQAASALRNAQLFTAEREQRTFAEALSQTAAAVNSTLDPDAVINTILTSIRQVIPYDTASVTMLTGDFLVMTQSVGYEGRVPEGWVENYRVPFSEMRHTSQMRITGQPVVIRDTRLENWGTSASPTNSWIRSTVKAPIFVDGEFVGAIHLESVEPEAFDDKDAARLMTFVSQAAVALRNAQLFTAERDQRTFAEALSDTAAAINRVLDPEVVMDRILDNIAQAIPYDAATVMVVEEDGVITMPYHRGYKDRGVDQWLANWRQTTDTLWFWPDLQASGSVLVYNDTQRCKEWVASTSDPIRWVGASIKAPIVVEDKVAGIINLDCATPNSFSPQHIARLRSFADQAANALRNARLFAAERAQRVLAEALRDSAAAINSTLKHDEVMDRILINLEQVARYDMAEILLIDGDEAYLARYWQAEPGRFINAETLAQSERMRVSSIPNLLTMAETGLPCVIRDTHSDPEWLLIPGWEWVRSQAAAPIKRQDHVIGFVMLDSAQPNYYAPAVGERLQAFADQAALALSNAELYARVQNYAEEQERAVQIRTAQLAAQHAQLQTILDTMAEGLIFSIGGDLRYANRACGELLGLPLADLHGGFMQVVEMINPTADKPEDVNGRIVRTLERGRTWKGDLNLLRADGQEFDAAVSVTPVPGLGDEQPPGLLTMIRDISQEKALQAQRDRFIAHASHELRTPLANIKTRLYLLKNQPHKLDQHMVILERVANDMNELVENLLDVSRFERGVITLSPRPMVLQDLLRDIVMIQQAEAERKLITLTLVVPETPFRIQGDPNRMRQVFTNLVTNAINYTPEGGMVTVSAEVDPTQPDQRVVCRVHDTGVGIEPEQFDHVFEPFFRANQGMATGTGLGLSIAKEIVTLHQGEITVDSVVGEGSTFSVVLDLIAE